MRRTPNQKKSGCSSLKVHPIPHWGQGSCSGFTGTMIKTRTLHENCLTIGIWSPRDVWINNDGMKRTSHHRTKRKQHQEVSSDGLLNATHKGFVPLCQLNRTHKLSWSVHKQLLIKVPCNPVGIAIILKTITETFSPCTHRNEVDCRDASNFAKNNLNHHANLLLSPNLNVFVHAVLTVFPDFKHNAGWNSKLIQYNFFLHNGQHGQRLDEVTNSSYFHTAWPRKTHICSTASSQVQTHGEDLCEWGGWPAQDPLPSHELGKACSHPSPCWYQLLCPKAHLPLPVIMSHLHMIICFVLALGLGYKL